MHEYQKTHGIQRQCMANVQYLYDFIKVNCPFNAKARAVFVCSDEGGYAFICPGHMVIEIAGGIIDPSYEIASLKDPQYIGNYSTFIEMFPQHKSDKELLKTYMNLCKQANEINSGGLCVANRLFYHAQADWVGEKLTALGLGYAYDERKDGKAW
jgi:hypothetical protein